MKILLKFVSKGPVYNKPALVQIMMLYWKAGKPLSKPVMILLIWCKHGSLVLSELTHVSLNKLADNLLVKFLLWLQAIIWTNDG